MTGAAADLNRIVQLVADVSRDPRAGDDGVPIADLAARLGTTAAQVRQDLRTLTAISDEASAEWLQSLSVWQEGDRVSAVSRGPYRRPLKFTPEELLAIRVGLAMEGETGEALAMRLNEALGELKDQDPPVWIEAANDTEAGVLALADREMAAGRTLRIKYAGERGGVPSVRSVEVHQVAGLNGTHYLMAWCRLKNDWRHFRVDRVLDAAVEDTAFEPRVLFERVETVADVFRSDAEGDEVTVRYSPSVARWMAERFPDARRLADGAVEVTYRVVEPAWLVRMVLQYGTEAEVVAPASYRARIARAVA
jgi:predicted DNA-binding transcriptional regulator YafY